MREINIESILSEYEQKRRKKEQELVERKQIIYKQFPRLEEIENEINKISILKAKSIMLHNYSDSTNTEIENKMLNLKNEKKEILNKAKITEEDLKVHYDCKKCNDTGYIKHIDKKTEMCTCLKQEIINISYDNSNISNLRKENFDNFNLNIFLDKVDIAKYQMNISPRKNIENIKNASISFIENFENANTKNLFFTGNTGLGKTYMTNCIANEILKKEKTVLYQTAPILLETIIDSKFNKNKNNFYNQVLNTDLLIIDDLGTEFINQLKLSELFTILNARSLNLNNKITKTIISTNLSIEKIFEIYEERIGSRIAGYYNIYYFFGEDLRLKK